MFNCISKFNKFNNLYKLNKSYKLNFIKSYFCNLAVNCDNCDNCNNYDNYINYDDLFIEEIKYNSIKKYFYETKKPYYLDDFYIKEKNMEKINIICESTGSKCILCNGTGYNLNEYFKYDLCKLCNGNGMY